MVVIEGKGSLRLRFGTVKLLTPFGAGCDSMTAVNDQTLQIIAERYLGSATCEDYVAWAVACLEANLDSKNIRILSSLRKPLYSSEVDEYFKRSLADLGWAMPAEREFLFQYLRRLAQRIVSREIPPLVGCAKIYRVVVALEYPGELTEWVYLDEGLDPAGFNELVGAGWDQAIISEAERLLESLSVVREK